jgi:threonine/homoserine/homoserine lactone efflux protein
MSIEIWIAFTIAAFIILVIPGPTILLVVSQAIAHGRRAVWPLVGGVILGDFTAMTLSLIGLGAVISASAKLFLTLKWFGAGYLLYLGIKIWRAQPENGPTQYADQTKTHRELFRDSFIVTALNPKSIAFFIAFMPQFVSPRQESVPQLLLMGATFLFLAAVNASLYGLFAGSMRDVMQNRSVRKWFNRCGGTALIGAAVFTAAMHRSQ